MAPGIYLPTHSIQDLIKLRDQIFAIHNSAWNSYTIDLLANDTLNALSIWEIVSQYDQDYNINFHRNGEDAMSNGVSIEQKCASKEPSKTKGTVGKVGFQFHAQGKLDYDRYVFAVRRKDNLKLVRLWDISSADAIALVQTVLQAKKQNWINRGKPNHDAILVEEKELMTLAVNDYRIIDGCEVFML